MTDYSVKLVDHTGSSDKFKQRIIGPIQGLFDEVFSGTSDSATVAWGTAEQADNIVLHFVDDVADSYISKKMPGAAHRADGGGFTRTREDITGSEFYKHMLMNGKRTMVHDSGYAKLAFHEALHNQSPNWTNQDMHGPSGGGGLASSPPQLPMTDRNKELMRKWIAVKNAQLL
jgi:hypothetical protein